MWLILAGTVETNEENLDVDSVKKTLRRFLDSFEWMLLRVSSFGFLFFFFSRRATCLRVYDKYLVKEMLTKLMGTS